MIYTTALYATLNCIILSEQLQPKIAAAKTTGIISLQLSIIVVTYYPIFGEIHTAPQPQESDAFENTSISGGFLPRSQSIEIPFHLSANKCHHKISA